MLRKCRTKRTPPAPLNFGRPWLHFQFARSRRGISCSWFIWHPEASHHSKQVRHQDKPGYANSDMTKPEAAHEDQKQKNACWNIEQEHSAIINEYRCRKIDEEQYEQAGGSAFHVLLKKKDCVKGTEGHNKNMKGRDTKGLIIKWVSLQDFNKGNATRVQEFCGPGTYSRTVMTTGPSNV